MSDVLNKFNILNEIDEEFKETINSFHIYQYLNKKNQLNFEVLFTTNTNQVFSFSSEKTINKIRNLNVKQFIIGLEFVLAFTREKEVFGWGSNQFGQLGRGSLDFYEDVQTVLTLKDIKDVCCGDTHSLALDVNGIVYGWGNNSSGQIGCGEETGVNITQPIQLSLPETVKRIYCSRDQSFAITITGKVYSWGSNKSYKLGHNSNQNIFEPNLIDYLSEVRIMSICCSQQTYFLTDDNHIYFCGPNTGINNQGQTVEPYQFDNHKMYDQLIKSLIAINYYNEDNKLVSDALALNDSFIFQLDLNSVSIHKSLFDYCSNEHQITHNTIDLVYDQRFVLPDPSQLGYGYSADVHKAIDRIRSSEFAIKLFNQSYINKYGRKGILREVNHMKQCSDEYVVKCYGYRFEIDRFYIILELCSNSLNRIIEGKPHFFNRRGNQTLSFWEYLISWLFFEEIVDCLLHLHETRLIHRDIKPDNILVNYEPINQKFLKLTDFGFAISGTNQDSSYDRWIGDQKYMAPEVKLGTGLVSDYSNKADIYSLGILAKDLFDYDINDDHSIAIGNLDNNLRENFLRIKEQMKQMREPLPKNRPECQKIKKEFEKIKFDKFKVFKQFKIDKSWTNNAQNDPVNKFLYQYVPSKLDGLCNDFEKSITSSCQIQGKFTRFIVDEHLDYYIYVANMPNLFDKTLLNDYQKTRKEFHEKHEKYLANYYDHFIYRSYLCIKMDYFAIDLKTIIIDKQRCFERNKSEPMSIIEYFISSCLMKEIIECVQCLHQEQIAHCDLTPDNIIIDKIPDGCIPNDYRFLKLANIGLITFSPDFQITQTIQEENKRYLAPENKTGANDQYIISADIYSLGRIACDIFNVYIDAPNEEYKYDSDEYLKNKWTKLLQLIRSMLGGSRPSCETILSGNSEYLIDGITELNRRNESETLSIIYEKMENFENKFFLLYFDEKCLRLGPF